MLYCANMGTFIMLDNDFHDLTIIAFTGLRIGSAYGPQNFSLLLNSLSEIFSLLTTLFATCFIALKIVLVTRQRRMSYSYAKIVEILVESAALLTFFLLGLAILGLVNSKHHFHLNTTIGRVSYELAVCLSYVVGPVIVRISHCFASS